MIIFIYRLILLFYFILYFYIFFIYIYIYFIVFLLYARKVNPNFEKVIKVRHGVYGISFMEPQKLHINLTV